MQLITNYSAYTVLFLEPLFPYIERQLLLTMTTGRLREGRP